MICMADFKRIPSSFSLSLQPMFVRPRAGEILFPRNAVKAQLDCLKRGGDSDEAEKALKNEEQMGLRV